MVAARRRVTSLDFSHVICQHDIMKNTAAVKNTAAITTWRGQVEARVRIITCFAEENGLDGPIL